MEYSDLSDQEFDLYPGFEHGQDQKTAAFDDFGSPPEQDAIAVFNDLDSSLPDGECCETYVF
jgi:hypothetical protein